MNKSFVILKITLSILLLLCLLDMPYGYYQFVRFAAMAGFAFLAYQYYEADSKNWTFVFGALALLFQPFFKVALGREIWNMVDVLATVILIASLFKKNDKR